MNSKQRRQNKRKLVRMADKLSDILIEFAQEAKAKEWSLERTLKELEETGNFLKEALKDMK